MMRKIVVWMMAAALWAGPAGAATQSGVSLPDTYPVAGHTLVLNGMAIRTVTFLRVRAYVVGLYVAQKSGDASAILASKGPKVILMQFLHSASKQDIEEHYREGEKNNCGHGECPKADEADFERLIAVTPAAAVGDTLTYFLTDQGVKVLFNSRTIAEVANADLGMRLLAGFIGRVPPSPEVKAGLLGATP